MKALRKKSCISVLVFLLAAVGFVVIAWQYDWSPKVLNDVVSGVDSVQPRSLQVAPEDDDYNLHFNYYWKISTNDNNQLLDGSHHIKRRLKRKGKRRRIASNISAHLSPPPPLNTMVPSLTPILKNRFPHYFIIGFAKTGTKALFEALKMHPQLDGPAREMRYFTDHYQRKLNYYLKRIPNPSQNGYTIEKSPDYILSQESAVRIKKAATVTGHNMTDLKFIIMLRNPVVRAVSEYIELQIWSSLNGRPKLPPFSDLVLTQTGEINGSLKVINNSCYIYYVERWLQQFPRDHICFVNGDHFITDPYKEIKILEKCLNLTSYFLQSHFVYETKKGFYCFKKVNDGPLVCMNGAKGRLHPFVDEKIIEKLKHYFQPWNKKLYSVVNRYFDWETSMKY